MSNMSYCRFRNTLADLRDCEEALRDGAWEDGDRPGGISNEDEAQARDRLVKLCRQIADDYGEEED